MDLILSLEKTSTLSALFGNLLVIGALNAFDVFDLTPAMGTLFPAIKHGEYGQTKREMFFSMCMCFSIYIYIYIGPKKLT